MSFQETEGCLENWHFLKLVQWYLRGYYWDGQEDGRATGRAAGRTDDDISDEEVDADAVVHEPVYLPEPTLARLPEVEELVHLAMTSIGHRESLAKFILNENYVPKLVAALEIAEDMESIQDLHRLCSIVKALILLNDASIFECIMRDDVFMGVAGILEYDPDFPYHKAEHRKYLSDESKFKEVVEVKDPEIKRKIHQTFRLQYLKDVILARILEDPTFSILNALIFFHQVDIIEHFQHNEEFLVALFGLFGSDNATSTADIERKSDAVLFIQQFTGIAKTLQPLARASLYETFVRHGLFQVLVFSLGSRVPPKVRLAGADIVMAVIDHDPRLIRGFIIDQSTKKETTLCDTLIALLLSETDLGVKAQMAEAMRLLLDPTAGPPLDPGPQKTADPGATPRPRKDLQDPEADKFLEMFYARNIKMLMTPLLETDFMQARTFNFEQASLYTHLCELLCFFMRAHTYRSKYFIITNNISLCISQVFSTSERHLHLAALRYFRVCIGMKDDYYTRDLIKNNLFEPLVNLLALSAHRDNLLNSAVLEFFESLLREDMRDIMCNLVEDYRSRLETIQIDTARALILRYEQHQAPPPAPEPSDPLDENEQENRGRNGRWQGRESMDRKEQEYFERDDEPPFASVAPLTPTKRPLVDVDYDAEEGASRLEGELQTSPVGPDSTYTEDHTSSTQQGLTSVEAELRQVAAPAEEKPGEKRRRSIEDDDTADLLRNRKTNVPDTKRNGSSQGGIANAVKKKMMFSFGKRDNSIKEESAG